VRDHVVQFTGDPGALPQECPPRLLLGGEFLLCDEFLARHVAAAQRGTGQGGDREDHDGEDGVVLVAPDQDEEQTRDDVDRQCLDGDPGPGTQRDQKQHP
jgi:hypothetical protein